MYQFRDAEATIIANPYSLSQSSDFPPSSATNTTTEQNGLNSRRSGLGIDYKGDPIGNTHSSEQLLSTSAQSGSVPSRPSSGQSSDNRQQITLSHLTVPPLPPRVLLPRTTPEPDPSCEKELHGAVLSHRCNRGWKITGSQGGGEDEEEEVERRACVYLQAAKEEGEKRQVCHYQIMWTCIIVTSHISSSVVYDLPSFH